MTTRHALRSLLSVLLLLLAVPFEAAAQGTVKPFVTVDAARYQPAVAPDSIVSGFTVAITSQNYFATEDVDSVTPGIQLPTSLGGLRVLVNNRLAELLYVGPNQINYIVPAATEVDATATVVVTNDQGTVLAQGDLYMAASSLNIFTQNQQGTGSPAAAFTADGITYTQVNNGDGSTNNVPPGNYLVLFGTGVREGQDVKAFIGGIEAQVDYAGPQLQYVALDQINLRVPEAVTGQGLLDVFITDGLTTSNTITINVGGNPEAPAGAPVITAFSSAEAVAGQVVTITGSQFPTTLSEASVKLGTTPGQIVSTSATALTFIVPYGAATDKITIGNTAGTRKSTASLAIKTSISGTVLDGQGAPVVGIPVSIASASLATTTDASGRFLLTDVPQGIAQVDIDTSSLPAALGLPTMTFSLIVTNGRDNEIGYPIYLPAGLGSSTFLNTVKVPNSLGFGLEARAEADTPVIIEHDGLKLEIPGLVTFPKNVREPRIGLTRLSADGRLPAPLPSKVYPSVVALMTPIGTTFGSKGEGLATLTFPNPDRFPAGTALDLYAFRPHVAPAGFVKKGTATVNTTGDKIIASSVIDFATIWFVGVPIDQVTFTNVVGKVVDSTGKPVHKARVFTRGRGAVTDSEGKFEIKGVRAKNDDELRIDAMFFTPAGNPLRAFKLVKAVVPGNTDAGTIQLPAPPALSILIRPMEARIKPGATIDMTLVLSRKFSAPATFNLTNEEGVKLEISPASLTLEAGQTEASFKVKGDMAGKGSVVAKLAAAVDDATPDNSRKGFAIVYVMNPAPVLTSITPTSGAPGSTFTLVGTGFGSEAQQHQVHFKQNDRFMQADPRTLKLTPGTDGNASLAGIVPGLRVGEVEVFISVMRSGVLSEPSNKLKFTVTPAPAPKLETITPNTGMPGASFTLAGVGLDPNPKNNGIFFKLGDKVIPSPVELLRVLTTPEADGSVRVQGIVPRMPAGDAEVFAVVFRNGAPSEPSNKLAFKVLAPEGAKLDTIDPTEGAPGVVFTIKGSSFDPEPRRNFVFFKKGDRFFQLDPSTLKTDGKTFISGVVPRVMPGDYEVFVVTNLESVPATAGKLPGTPSNPLPFKVLPPPGAKLETIDPVEGLAGAMFSIKGSGWGTDARAFRVVFKQGERFLMLEPASIRFDATTIAGKVPNVAPGDYEVLVVTNIDLVPGSATTMPGVLSNPLRFKVLPPPGAKLETIDPVEGKPGTAFTIKGSGFGNDPKLFRVMFKQGDRFMLLDPATVRTDGILIGSQVPNVAAGDYEVFVLTNLDTPVPTSLPPGVPSNGLRFKVLGDPVTPPTGAPELLAISPVEGKPGELFKLTGKNFSTDITVTFMVGTIQHIMNGARLKITETTIEAELPAMPPGEGKVWVHNRVGKSNELPFKFLAPDKPTLESITPGEGAPGTKFTLKGLKFRKFYELFFKQGERVVCVPHNQIQGDETMVMGIVPGVPAGDYEVYIGFVGGVPFSNGLPFKVLPIANPAKLIAIDPVEGKGGAPFKLTGENLLPVYHVVFRQGDKRSDINPDGYRFENGMILGMIPNMAPGEAEVFLALADGAPASNILRFKFLSDTTTPRPELETISPTEGAPGLPFKLTGKNFIDGQTVYFRQGTSERGIPKESLKITATTIEGVLPALPPGAAEVFVRFGSDGVTNKLPFKFLAPPNLAKLDTINPTDVTPGQPFKLTGVNLAPFYEVAFKQDGKFIDVPRHLLKFTDGTMIEGVVPGLKPGVAEVAVGYGTDDAIVVSNLLPVKVLAPPPVALEAISSVDGRPEGIPGAEFKLTGRNLAPFYTIVFKQGDRVIKLKGFSYRVVDGVMVGKLPDLPAGGAEVTLALTEDGPAVSNILSFTFKPKP